MDGFWWMPDRLRAKIIPRSSRKFFWDILKHSGTPIFFFSLIGALVGRKSGFWSKSWAFSACFRPLRSFWRVPANSLLLITDYQNWVPSSAPIDLNFFLGVPECFRMSQKKFESACTPGFAYGRPEIFKSHEKSPKSGNSGPVKNS